MSWLDRFFTTRNYGIIQAAGVAVQPQPAFNFIGANVSVANDASNQRTNITIAGATAPTGSGFVTVTSGAFDAASRSAAAGIYTFLATPSSANLIAAMTDETGTGQLMFGTSPTVKTSLIIRNPADTFGYTITPGAIAANRIITMQALTSDDSFAFLAAGQTFTNKTIVLASNTITDTGATTGDIMRHNGTRFVRLARGAANTVLTTNGAGTDIAWASSPGGLGTNVLSGTNYISIGTSPAAAGGLRMANTLGISSRNAGNTADFNLINADAGGQVNVGDSTAYMSCVGSLVTINSNGALYMYSGGAQCIVDDGSTATSFAHPIVGLATAWGAVDAQIQVAVAASNITLTSAQYNTKITKLTGAPAATRTITFPAPADDAHAYLKVVWCQTTVSGCTITTGAGLTVACIVNDAPHLILFTTAGCVRIT